VQWGQAVFLNKTCKSKGICIHHTKIRKIRTHLFGTSDLLQESTQLPGFCVESPAHGLVVTGDVRQTGEVGCAQLEERKNCL